MDVDEEEEEEAEEEEEVTMMTEVDKGSPMVLDSDLDDFRSPEPELVLVWRGVMGGQVNRLVTLEEEVLDEVEELVLTGVPPLYDGWVIHRLVPIEDCHRASFSRSLHFLFTSFSTPSTQLPYLPSLPTHSRTTTRQDKTMILVQCGLAIRGGLRNYSTGCYIVPSTFEDRPPIVLSFDEIPHRIKQVTLRRSLPGSQCLLFPLELEVHLSQPPRTQRARLEDDDHATMTDKDGTTI